jgi:hypothetical protein
MGSSGARTGTSRPGVSGFVFSWDYDMFADGSKARRFGFHEYIDTEAMFLNVFDEFRRRNVIP